jgi:hypothetical protein
MQVNHLLACPALLDPTLTKPLPRPSDRLDIHDWESTAAGLTDKQFGYLKHMVGRVTAEVCSEGLIVGEIGDGRFAVLGPCGLP